MSGINSSGIRAPVWIERDDLLLEKTLPRYPALDKDVEADVLVVGGGISGVHIAYELLTSGVKNVVLVEDGKISSGETGRTTGHLSVDNEYNDFVELHGPELTAEIAASQQAAVDRIASIVEKHRIDCDFVRVPGFMFHGLPENSKDFELDTISDIYKAAAGTHKLDVSLVDDAGIIGFNSGRAIKFDRQATFHPTKYVRALAEIITEMGGSIYEKSHMNEYSENEKGVEAVMVNGKKVRAGKMVMATNVPLQKLVVIDRVEAYRTYAVALKIPNSAVSKNGDHALWWDLGDPYHYIRVTPHKDEGYSLLVVGGEDEKVGQHSDSDERYQRLIDWTKERWTGALDVEYQWSGQVMDSQDGIAYIGRNPGNENIFIQTGDNGDGLTYSAIGGMLIRDLILGKTSPWADLYSPSRQHSTSHLKRAVKALPEYIKGNLSDQMYMAKWLTTATKTMKDIEDLMPGEGEVVREGVHPVAVYKDEGGQIHKMTGICPHLKGIVAWNSGEKSFDCPIHGSRFTCRGEVVNGPAIGNLTSQRDVVE